MKQNSMNRAFRCFAISLLAQFCCQAPCLAQAPGGAPAAGGVVVEMVQNDPKLGTGSKVENAQKQASNFLAERKLKRGYDATNKLYIFIGSEPIAVKAGDASFDDARQDAFMIALLDAKQQMAEFMGVRVKAEMEKIVKSGTPGQYTPSEASKSDGIMKALLTKALVIVNDAANKELMKRGLEKEGSGKDAKAVDRAKELEAARKKAADIVMDKSYKEFASISSRAEVSGAQVYRSFESIESGKMGSVAVVLVFNDSSKELTSALLGKGLAPKGVANKNLTDWVTGLGDEVLLYTQGAMMRTDEHGEVVLLAFGQASPIREDEDLAKEAENEARERAQLAARLFVGDFIQSNSDSERGFDLKKFKDVANSDEYKSTKKRLAVTKSTSEALNLGGGSPIYTWSAKHPMSDVTTEGCVLMFSLSSAEAANALRDTMNSLGGSKGGDGVSTRPAEAAPATEPTGAGSKKGSSSGAGAEGDPLLIAPKGGPGAPGQF